MECKISYDNKKNDKKNDPPQKNAYDVIRDEILKTNLGENYVRLLLKAEYLNNYLTVSDVQNLWDEYQKRSQKAPSNQAAPGKAKNAKKSESVRKTKKKKR